MTAFATIRVKIDWDNNGNFTGTYDDVSADVVSSHGLWFNHGFGSQLDRVASVGRCQFALRNDARNQHGEANLYSPVNSSSSLAGKIVPLRPVIVETVYNSTTTRQWTGYLFNVTPEPWTKTVYVECVDKMWALTDTRIGSLLYTDVQAGFLCSAVMGGVFTSIASSHDTGNLTFDFAGDGWQYEQVTGHQALRDIAESEWGRYWIDQDGTSTYWDTHHEFEDTTVAATFTNVATDLATRTPADSIVNRVNVEITPREVGDSAIVVATLDNPPYLNPGQTSETYTLRFRDPATGEPIAVAQELPMASGTDYSPSAGITGGVYSTTATSWTFEIVNTNDYPVQMELWQLRGYPVYEHEPITMTAEDTTSQSTYTFGKPKVLSVRLPLSDSTTFAQLLAQYLLSRHAYPYTYVESVTYVNKDTSTYADLLSLRVMDLISVEETAIGLSNTYRILNIEQDIRGKLHQFKFLLEPYNEQNYARWNSGTWDDATWAPL